MKHMDSRTLRFYRNRGFTILNFVRHPLDVIVSCAGKISSFTIRSDNFQGCRRHALTLIDDLDWFQSMVEAIARYLELTYQNRPALAVFRYEDLIDNPMETIRRIAEVIGVEVDPAAARELWARRGFKP